MTTSRFGQSKEVETLNATPHIAPKTGKPAGEKIEEGVKIIGGGAANVKEGGVTVLRKP